MVGSDGPAGSPAHRSRARERSRRCSSGSRSGLKLRLSGVDETLPLWFPVVLAFAGLVLLAIGGLSTSGRLPRNFVAGIRTSTTMANDQAWAAAHKAAASLLLAAGSVSLSGALLVTAVRASLNAAIWVTVATTVAMLALSLQALRVAQRAARPFGREASLRRVPNK